MATPTFSGIPYPTMTSSLRRDAISGQDLTLTGRRGSLGTQAPITAGYVMDSTTQSIITTGTMGMGTGLRGVPSVETLTESVIPRRVNQMDMEFQKVKLYDSRKRPESQIFEDSNGSAFSNYIAQRTSRVVEEYRRFKYEEARNLNQQFSPNFLAENRRASSLSLGQRAQSGSFTQLNQIPPSRIEETGPVEIVEWFTRDNGREHRTDRYEVTMDYRRGYQIPVYRRGQNFFMAMRMASGRALDLQRNPIFVTFNFGKKCTSGRLTALNFI